MIAVIAVALWAPSASRTLKRPARPRRPWLVGLGLVGLGAVFFVLAAIDPPGFDLGADLELSALVDAMGGGLGATGFAVGLMLAALLLLGLVDSARSGRVLVRVALLAVPLMALATVLTALLDRDEWRDGSIGPLVATIVVFTLPALLAGSLLQRAESQGMTYRRHDERGGTLDPS